MIPEAPLIAEIITAFLIPPAYSNNKRLVKSFDLPVRSVTF
jgi:hypothetical protein